MNETILVNVESGNSKTRWSRQKTFVLCFGAYGDTHIMTSADNLEDALENAADWLENHAPGIFCDEAVTEEYNRAIAEGLTEEAAQNLAEVDTTSVCSGNHYIASWEWGIVLEDPTRDQLKAYLTDRTRKVA